MIVEHFPVTDRHAWLTWRKQDVTASVAASLFGEDVHPYMSPYELFCLKAGLIDEDPEETPAMKRGRLLEPVGLQLMQEQRPDWKIWNAGEYWRDTEHRIGATPDWYAERPDRIGRGIVQFKTAGKFAFEKGWMRDHMIELPLWIAVQASIEAGLTGTSWAVVAVMVLGDGGLDLHVIDVPLKEKLMPKMRDLAIEFWRRVKENDPYPPNYGRDAAIIANRFMADADENSVKDLTKHERAIEIVAKRATLKEVEARGNAAVSERKPLDAEIMDILGNSALGQLPGGQMIEVKIVRKKSYVVKDSQYPQVRIK